MKFLKSNGQPLPAAIVKSAKSAGRDDVSRREFLAIASSFGATTATAYAMLGMPAPAQAAAHAQMGGTVRIQMSVRGLKDPRTYDWSQIANFARGWLEYLVFLQLDQILDNAHRLRDIPGVIVHGRYDVVCPVEQAWLLQRAWPGAELQVVPDAGHSALEPGIVDALVRATEQTAMRLR